MLVTRLADGTIWYSTHAVALLLAALRRAETPRTPRLLTRPLRAATETYLRKQAGHRLALAREDRAFRRLARERLAAPVYTALVQEARRQSRRTQAGRGGR